MWTRSSHCRDLHLWKWPSSLTWESHVSCWHLWNWGSPACWLENRVKFHTLFYLTLFVLIICYFSSLILEWRSLKLFPESLWPKVCGQSLACVNELSGMNPFHKVYIYQIITLTLWLSYSFICHLYLNKAGKTKKDWETLLGHLEWRATPRRQWWCKWKTRHLILLGPDETSWKSLNKQGQWGNPPSLLQNIWWLSLIHRLLQCCHTLTRI